ncbi:hypothetical protein [Paraburkholderia sacchari]|uniref:hypothetical protein n=1 Tax=Paraburkholderia sacchari TaxID=159450 RepID=UPI0039A47E76
MPAVQLARRYNSRRSVLRNLIVELKQLRLHGMAAGWAELLEQGNAEVPYLDSFDINQKRQSRARQDIRAKSSGEYVPSRRLLR